VTVLLVLMMFAIFLTIDFFYAKSKASRATRCAG
jgi:hypothetical protein